MAPPSLYKNRKLKFKSSEEFALYKLKSEALEYPYPRCIIDDQTGLVLLSNHPSTEYLGYLNGYEYSEIFKRRNALYRKSTVSIFKKKVESHNYTIVDLVGKSSVFDG